MTDIVRFCVVRHGETGWNAERRLQGHVDIPLNATGEAQALATAQLLSGHAFDAAYTSDLRRAADTAAAICASRRPASPRADLRERHYGIFQGLTYTEAETRHPEAYAHFEARTPDEPIPGGGESLTRFQARIRAAFDAMADAHAGQTVLVVAHGGVLDILNRMARQRPLEEPRDFKIPNAALNWLRRAPEGWSIEAWAQEAHLPGARDELPNS